ncbi:MAG TPA: DUF4956 domain-containing protein [Longimicrobiales bacterium]|nr:DUF4956 domain-containing protein [Longimicrobiales bacterium]
MTASNRRSWWRPGRSREAPLLRLLLYYVALIGLALLLMRFVPAIEHAVLAPIDPDAGAAVLFGAREPAPVTGAPSAEPEPTRALTTFVVAFGALLLALPTAWVYMFTRRLRYDTSLVQSVVILPIVVSGIVIVVKNSLALAFSLAGIVAAVRFRNTLKDPKDAVYVFLTIGIGLAAGVQALDIALVMSLTFNVLVLLLWKYNVGAIYSGVSADLTVLSVGNRKLMTVRDPAERERVKTLGGNVADDIEGDGVLLVHTEDSEAAHRALEVSLSRLTSQWRLLDSVDQGKGWTTLMVVVELRKKVDPAEVLGELDERWSPHIAAAEFVSLRTHEVAWDGRERRDEE